MGPRLLRDAGFRDATKDPKTAGPPKGQQQASTCSTRDASHPYPQPLKALMHRSFLIASTAALALALGCGEQQSPTAPADQPAPSVRASVERLTDVFPFGVFGFSDGSRTLIFGAPFEDLVTFCPAAVPTNDLFEILVVTRPDGSIKFNARGEEVNVVVFDAFVPDAGCDVLLGAPHYTGTVRVHAEDNDLFVSGNRANASQITVTGTVTDESGQEYHLTSFSHQVLAPGTAVVLQSKVKIHLTPIGR